MSSVTIEKIAPGGRGVARLSDGRVALVAGAFPSDQVELESVVDRRSFVEARARVVQANAPRRPTPCPVAARCGGCDWMELVEPEQQRLKLQLVGEALRRTGRFEELACALEPAPSSLGYRQRVRLQLVEGRLGFYSAKTHELVEMDACAVAAPAINEALPRVRALVAAHARALSCYSGVEVRVAPGASAPTLHFALQRGQQSGGQARAALNELRRAFLVSADDVRDGEELETFCVAQVELLAERGVFTQVNWGVNEQMVDAVVRGAQDRACATFADLYCGIGNFSLPLARAGLSGRGVEVSERSIASARRAAKGQGARVEFTVGDVAIHAARWAQANERWDLVIVDPPRAGARDALKAVARLARKSVVMVSCDPVTFARDLRQLVELGLRVERVQAFDMFPQTHHVECMAWLEAR